MSIEKIKLQLRVSVNCSKIHKALYFVFIVMLFIQTSNLLTSQVQTSIKEVNMIASSEKFCLNWNYFQKNISSTFQTIRDHLDLEDVTLASENNKQFQVHKFVLLTSNSFFTKTLMERKHPHHLKIT